MNSESSSITMVGDMYRIDGQSGAFDVQTLTLVLQMERVELLDRALGSQANQIKANNDKLRQAADMLAQVRALKAEAQTKDQISWSVDAENKSIKLDGYEISMTGSDSTWYIRELDANGNRTGTHTRIHNDPYVNESDGDRWEFKKDMTFMLNDGTKITVGTEGSNKTYSDTLTITKGDQAIQVTGIKSGNIEISDVTLNGRELDVATNDSHIVYEGYNGVRHWATESNISIGDIGGSWNRHKYALTDIVNETGELEKETAISEEMKTFFMENGIDINDADGDGNLTANEWDIIIDRMKGFQDSLNSTSQMDMIRLQQINNKRNQAYEIMTNTTNKESKTLDDIISNLR